MDFIFEDDRIYTEGKGGKILAEICFHDTGDGSMEIDRTFVDDSLRGQGIAGDLMKMAVDTIKRKGKRVTASCSYAVKWLEKNA